MSKLTVPEAVLSPQVVPMKQLSLRVPLGDYERYQRYYTAMLAQIRTDQPLAHFTPADAQREIFKRGLDAIEADMETHDADDDSAADDASTSERP